MICCHASYNFYGAFMLICDFDIVTIFKMFLDVSVYDRRVFPAAFAVHRCGWDYSSTNWSRVVECSLLFTTNSNRLSCTSSWLCLKLFACFHIARDDFWSVLHLSLGDFIIRNFCHTQNLVSFSFTLHNYILNASKPIKQHLHCSKGFKVFGSQDERLGALRIYFLSNSSS